MKKLGVFISSLIIIFSLSSCGYDLGFEPVRLYKFSAVLKKSITR